jgi:hypothetical protein
VPSSFFLKRVGIGHVDSTAGTLGCLVKDAVTGELRLRSNWHVLQGETGEIGDFCPNFCPSELI